MAQHHDVETRSDTESSTEAVESLGVAELNAQQMPNPFETSLQALTEILDKVGKNAVNIGDISVLAGDVRRHE